MDIDVAFLRSNFSLNPFPTVLWIHPLKVKQLFHFKLATILTTDSLIEMGPSFPFKPFQHRLSACNVTTLISAIRYAFGSRPSALRRDEAFSRSQPGLLGAVLLPDQMSKLLSCLPDTWLFWRLNQHLMRTAVVSGLSIQREKTLGIAWG